MDWKEEIKMGMLLIQSGCQRNPYTKDCKKCAFYEFCNIIEEAHLNPNALIPQYWNVEKYFKNKG